jgi:predicted RNase H-like nuclease (RuvC/YqgF family)
MMRRAAVGFVAIALPALLQPLSAQTARAGANANAQLLQQLQQLGAERTQLQAERDQQKHELESLRSERDSLKKAQTASHQQEQSSGAALKESAARRAQLEQELQQTKDKMQELIGKFRETIQTLKATETERAAAKQALASRDQELNRCVDSNLALYKLNGEVLGHLEHTSMWSHVARAEPFTQIKRVQLENLVDDYKARADLQRVTPPAPLPAAPAAVPAAEPSSQATPPDGAK